MPKSEAEGIVDGVTKNRPHERYWFLSSEKNPSLLVGALDLKAYLEIPLKI